MSSTYSVPSKGLQLGVHGVKLVKSAFATATDLLLSRPIRPKSTSFDQQLFDTIDRLSGSRI